MHSRQAMVDKIMSWLGCHEGDPTHKHIVDTYNSQKPLPSGYKLKYTDPWCAATVSAAAIECGYTDIIPTECSCNRMIKLLQQKGIWVENDAYVPKPGDIIFYDWDDNGVGDDTGGSEHVGVVVSDVKNNQFQVCEGNKSDGVGLRTMTVNGKYIRGYGVPKYDDVAPVPSTPIKKQALGLDLSACQTSVDFNKVKAAGYEFVILRSTTKNGQPDIKFEEYWKGATKAGLKIAGVYKLCYAMDVLQAKAEAAGVIKLLNGRKCDIWIDVENAGGQQVYGKQFVSSIITAFLTYCVEKGYDVGIYCNEDWYKNYISDDIKKICRFWVARYGKNTGQIDENYRPKGIKGMVMWQYTSHGQVDGVKAYEHNYVDLNVKC